MSEKEISFNEELGTFEPCSTCLEIAMDAAYCDGFQTEDDEYIILDDEDYEVTPFFGVSMKGDEYD